MKGASSIQINPPLSPPSPLPGAADRDPPFKSAKKKLRYSICIWINCFKSKKAIHSNEAFYRICNLHIIKEKHLSPNLPVKLLMRHLVQDLNLIVFETCLIL